MPRKKGDKAKQAKARIAKPLSQMEQEIKKTQLENDMLEKTLKQKRKHLEELAEIKAQERLVLADDDNGELPEGEEPEPEPRELPRHRFMSPRGVAREQEEQLIRAENFDKTLEGFQQTEGKVHVYRLKDGVYCKMSVIEAKEWNDGLEGIAKRFGGGTFKVRLHAPDGTFAGETVQHFDEEAYPKPGANAPAAVIVPPAPDMTPMLRMIQEQNAQARQDMKDTMMMIAEIFKSQNKPSNPLVGNINELMMFKEMMADKKNPASELSTLVGVLQKGMELGQAAAPVEEGGILGNLLGKLLNGDTLAKVATALTPAITPPAEAPAAPAAQAPVPRQLPPPPVAKPPVRQNPPQKPKEDGKMNLIVAMYKPQIIGLAEKGEAPKKVAEQIVARIAAINDGWLLIVDDAIRLPGTKEKFVYGFAPELKKHDKWVTSVMKEMSLAIKRLIDEAAAEARAEEAAAKAAKTPPPEPEAP